MSRFEMISERGWRIFEEEQTRLLKVERPRVVQQVSDAAAEGDRSENAEYIYGKKRLREIDRRLKYLTLRLTQVRVEPPPTQSDHVAFLSTVEVENLDTGEVKRFQIVGPDEGDPKAGRISYLSPIGLAMMGKRVSEDFEFEAPGGKRCYEILSISIGHPSIS